MKTFWTVGFALAVICMIATPGFAAKKEAKNESLAPEKPALSTIARDLRLEHAKELLGKYYRSSVVKSGEQIKKINSSVYRWTREALPKKYKHDYQKIAQAILDESVKHEFDPVFVLSVIQNESSFNPSAIGPYKEVGLMQLKPDTAEWIAKKAGLKWKGEKSLRDPVQNIRLGTAFLAYLREEFDSHARLYLSAYNMGEGNVREALDREVWPKNYASKVMTFYVAYYTQLKEKSTSHARPAVKPSAS
jgi:soluble lytic murein transglycosylase